MKVVVAYVQPFMSQRVVHALHAVNGLSGASFTPVRGFGRGRGGGSREAQEEELLGTVRKMRVEVMVSDALEQIVVRAIQDAARTGRKGDGKVFVWPLERAIRISTGEEDAV